MVFINQRSFVILWKFTSPQSDLKQPRSFGTLSKMSSGDKSILRIYGGFGRNLTRFDFDKNKVISRWSMFSNADLNIYEQLILNQPNENEIWNISNWNFTLYNDFYSGYSFFYQNEFYFVTHSNGILNQSYQLFKVNQSDNLESVQACLDFKLQPCSYFQHFRPKIRKPFA